MTRKKPVEILLVEDNPSDEELTIRAFKKNNLEKKVYCVRDGEEALDFLFARNNYSDREIREKPKLILLDLKLPKVDGLEVLRQIKNNRITKTIPVVVLTSSREERDIVRSYELGVNSYISKPVDFDKFVKAVTDVGLYWFIMNEVPYSKN
ncbi:MAG TPA: response regulator [Candidatus Cloacimonetes bacterium]|nr:response regulator [Candidatus Cloacimonadota bacterium]HEX37690.1 response regulator [Candidatus Cloacimonadota bacterium]